MKIEHIKDLIEEKTKLKLQTDSRLQHLVYTRAVLFTLCKKYTTSTLYEIGKLVGRDHASVLHGIKLYNQVIQRYDDRYKDLYNEIEFKIRVNLNLKPKHKDIEYYKHKYGKILVEYRQLLKLIPKEILKQLRNLQKETNE
ncbi:MAG: hypothetical protein Tp156SUR1554471_26 [Prokaryotic dsDNA virus sp.]|nr:MAG: hypothetical protein Tp156SUR1554471_26 [Prokaryotic dsDNA virus sp.]|tara:strand:- start:14622 stop:15044 length:423 start_codon:yes stop_codon:yes gene_type:complete